MRSVIDEKSKSKFKSFAANLSHSREPVEHYFFLNSQKSISVRKKQLCLKESNKGILDSDARTKRHEIERPCTAKRTNEGQIQRDANSEKDVIYSEIETSIEGQVNSSSSLFLFYFTGVFTIVTNFTRCVENEEE